MTTQPEQSIIKTIQDFSHPGLYIDHLSETCAFNGILSAFIRISEEDFAILREWVENPKASSGPYKVKGDQFDYDLMIKNAWSTLYFLVGK